MTPDILLIDACLLPEPATGEVVERGYVAIRDGLIEGVGPMDALPGKEAGQIIDAAGDLVLPGLVNGHCHAAMTLFRGLADDLELMTWLTDHIFPAEAENVTPEMVYWCARLAAAEMLLSGTTCVADGYFYEDEAARAFSEAGLRAVAAQGVIDFPAPGVPDPLENIRTAARFLDAWLDRDPLITPAIFAHSPYTCSGATLQKAKEESRQRNLPFYIHAAEIGAEQGLIRDPLGSSPVRHLDALGILDEMTVCVHCVHVDAEDMDIMARRRVRVVHCAQSNMKLASGMAPVDGMLEREITVGLGTDGAASNNSLDLFREMDLCAKMEKVRTPDPTAGSARAVLAMAAGAGTLAPGQPADLISVGLNRPHLQPFYGPDTLVYAGSGSDVQNVIVNGRLVVRDSELLTIDLEETLDRVRRLAETLR